ncbi:transcriptional regulator [Dactylosporangium sp. CS-033363]|uniref:transcriptional regulator n=1 Tax=Dactylosporangium sp. CS-033363 TaxID=3239935 RepID=UPI003D8F6FBF
MALKGGTRFSVRFEDVFPAGCVLVPDSIVEAQDFNEKTRSRTPAVDKLTGERVWTVRVMDMDPDLAGRSREVAVKITAPVRPVPESSVPFSPVEFEGMTVTPYVPDTTGRLTYSLRATGFRVPVAAGRASK